jgi:hypothetical protein
MFRLAAGGLTAGSALVSAGCESEERIVYRRPFLSGLPGSESGTPVSRNPKGYIDPTYVPDEQLAVTKVDGSKTLTARTARHLMMHIYTCMMNNQEELFIEQVLSERTKSEYYQRGRDPKEAFQAVQARAGDILVMFERMPMGESTPGLYLENVEKGVQRLQLRGLGARDLHWIGFDMVIENGNWRLLWFVPGTSRSR